MDGGKKKMSIKKLDKNTDKKVKKKKKLIFFVLTFFISIVFLGSISLCVWHYFKPIALGNDTSSSAKTSESSKVSYKPNSQDSTNIILIATKNNIPKIFFLIRFDAVLSKVKCSALPPQALFTLSKKKDTLSELYRKGGYKNVVNAIENDTQIIINNYIQVEKQSFVKAVDIFGGVENYLDRDITYINEEENSSLNLKMGQQNYDGNILWQLFLYPSWSEGPLKQYVFQTHLTEKLIDTQFNSLLVPSLDGTFTTLVNMIKTDISYLDYQERKPAILFFLEKEGDKAESVLVSGQVNSETKAITVSPSALDLIKLAYK